MKQIIKTFSHALSLIVFVLSAACAVAHPHHSAYLKLKETDQGFDATWSIPLVEISHLLELDQNNDGEIVWAEISAIEEEIKEHLFPHIYLNGKGRQTTLFQKQMLYEEKDYESFIVLPFSINNQDGSGDLVIRYDAFEFFGKEHRCLVNVQNGEDSWQQVLKPDAQTVKLSTTTVKGSSMWIAIVGEGLWHILIGYDHILFLLALVFPVVLSKSTCSQGLLSVMSRTLVIATAFAIAHSITLAVSVLGWVRLPEKGIELAIAATVGIAALSNLSPRWQRHGWQLAFGFGLIHGFGFANILNGLELSGTALIPTLLFFNLGVELGQILIISALIPLAYALRDLRFYQVAVLRGGSLAIFGTSVFWFFARL
jgi:hypothetical protein